MQKEIGEMTHNQNHDAEFIAKVMNERDRVLAEKEQHSEEARKAFERAKRASKEGMRRKNAELEAVRRQMKQAQAENKSLEVDRDVLLKEHVRLEQVCLEQVCEAKFALVELQTQIADLTAENTRLEVCAESSTADRPACVLDALVHMVSLRPLDQKPTDPRQEVRFSNSSVMSAFRKDFASLLSVWNSTRQSMCSTRRVLHEIAKASKGFVQSSFVARRQRSLWDLVQSWAPSAFRFKSMVFVPAPAKSSHAAS